MPMDQTLHGRAVRYVINKRFKSFEDLHARLGKVFNKVHTEAVPSRLPAE